MSTHRWLLGYLRPGPARGGDVEVRFLEGPLRGTRVRGQVVRLEVAYHPNPFAFYRPDCKNVGPREHLTFEVVSYWRTCTRREWWAALCEHAKDAAAWWLVGWMERCGAGKDEGQP